MARLRLLPTVMEYIGSVEGRLETISVHKVNKFIVYHAISKKAITCLGKIDLETAKRALGHKVLVSGMLFINAKNEPLRVNVSAIRILGSKTLLKASELTGSEPNITGPLSTEESFGAFALPNNWSKFRILYTTA